MYFFNVLYCAVPTFPCVPISFCEVLRAAKLRLKVLVSWEGTVSVFMKKMAKQKQFLENLKFRVSG